MSPVFAAVNGRHSVIYGDAGNDRCSFEGGEFGERVFVQVRVGGVAAWGSYTQYRRVCLLRWCRVLRTRSLPIHIQIGHHRALIRVQHERGRRLCAPFILLPSLRDLHFLTFSCWGLHGHNLITPLGRVKHVFFVDVVVVPILLFAVLGGHVG